MNEPLKLYSFLCLVFIFLLAVAGLVGGIFGEVIQVIAYAAPVTVGFFIAPRFRREREEIAGLVEPIKTHLGMTGRAWRLTLPLVFPTVAVVFLVSFLTSLLLGAIGAQSGAVLDGPLYLLIITKAILPAALEELLFRFLPLILLLPYGKRECVIISSVYFALFHCNLFSIPYALVAGVVFILIDIAAESVWPSFIIHLVNNLSSIVWMKYCTTDLAVSVYVWTLVGLALVSITFMLLMRRDYIEAVKDGLRKGGGIRTLIPYVVIIPTVFIAVINLITSIGG